MAPRVLLLSAEPLAARMPGPAIRALELARALAPHAEVSLAAPRATGARAALALPLTEFHRADVRPLQRALERVDVVVGQPPWPHVAAAIRASGARFVADLYDPEPFEVLERTRGQSASRRRLVAALTQDRIEAALLGCDAAICASEAQRDLWLGMLLGVRGLGAAHYDADPSLRAWLDVVPFGLPSTPPAGTGAGIPGVEAGDEVALWNGGIWPWLDPETAIRAVAGLAERRPRVRLVFMGGSGPAADAARTAARTAGVLGTHVHFHDGWVPYDERADWLLAAACAISTHREHLETRFAFRTRLLDCFWAGLPVVCTRGDALAARVERDGLGATVAPGDVEGLADALGRVLDGGRDAVADGMAQAREDFAWERVTAPLVRMVTTPGPRRPGAGTGPLARRARDRGFRALLAATGRRWWPTP